MIKVISFDFYGTLVTWMPSGEQIQLQAAKAEGLQLDTTNIGAAYAAADRYLELENSIMPIPMRSSSKKKQVFVEYERILLVSLNAKVTSRKAQEIWERVEATPKKLTSYQGARSVLESLIAKNLKIGIISNIGHGLPELMESSGLDNLASFLVSSGEVGFSKPHPAIFEAAIRISEVDPSEIIHVGDSIEGDVHGAIASGIHAVLIDRSKLIPKLKSEKYNVINSLEQLLPLIK